MRLARYQQQWNDMAKLDPLWAVLSDPKRRFGEWRLDDFFLTGQKEINDLIKTARGFGYPKGRDAALDFGCGVGRLTRALATHFRTAYGVDIANEMLAKARDLNSDINCTFILNDSPSLSMLPNNSFDLIYSNFVLQHMKKRLIRGYVLEFARVLKNGGLLCFQLPSYIPFRRQLQPRRRLYAALRAVGVGEGFLYKRLNLVPWSGYFLPQQEIIRLLHGAHLRLLQARSLVLDDRWGMINTFYYFQKPVE
jgi:SAM-dependent methyltransferase